METTSRTNFCDTATLSRRILRERGIRRFEAGIPEKELTVALDTAYSALLEARGVREAKSGKNMSRIASLSRWLNGAGKPSLLLYGGYGTGKTTLMQAAGYALQAFGIDYTYKAARFFDDPRNDFTPCRKPSPLMVDEFGREQEKVNEYGNVTRPIMDVLLYRHEKGYPTILATNLLMEEMGDRYGEYFLDRLRGGYEMIFYDEKSYRK